jgi:hypothetical protein
MSAVEPGWPSKRPGFIGVWLDRMRAYVDAHPGSARPGDPVNLALAEGVTAFGDNHPAAVLNANGTVSLRGGFVYRAPAVAGAHNVLTIVAPYLPERLVELVVAATLIGSDGPVPAAATISITTGGTVQLMTPALVDTDLFEVVLDGVTYWPADG